MKRFLANAKEVANQRFLNATGDGLYANGVNKFYAGGETKAISDPLIIICENTSTEASQVVELFDAGETAYLADPTVTGGGKVIKTSGVPEVSYAKIIRGIAGGNTYLFAKVRIECLEALTDAIKESAGGASIRYQVKTAQGHVVSKPLYPLLSSIQQVKSIRDLPLGEMLLNADTSFTIQSIPANTKMQYYFYPCEQGTPTGSLLRGDAGKEMQVESLNQIDL